MVSIRRTQVKATLYRHDPDLRRLSRWPLVTISALEDWIDRAIRRNVSFGERAASAACSQGNAAAYALTSYHKVQQARELLAPFTGGFDTRDLKEAKELLEESAQACLTHVPRLPLATRVRRTVIAWSLFDPQKGALFVAVEGIHRVSPCES